MSTAQPLPSSRPSSPTKPGHLLVLKSNPHPYAIKTTSTGILSRSATTSSSVSQSRNHYVPVSPSPSPTKSTHGGHAARGSRHRYSRSLTDDIPRPLPVPLPSEDVFLGEAVHIEGRGQRTRADTLPVNMHADKNPKLWTPAQLAAHVPDIAAFIEENEITGRAFLRFDDGVLNAYGVTQQWQRTQLLSASRTLRQSVLKDRIWSGATPNNTTPRPSTSATSSPTKARFQNLPRDDDDAYLSSSSSVSSTTSSLTGTRKRRYRPNSRVHGIVTSLEHEHRRDRGGSVSSIDSNSDSYNDYHTHHYPSSGRPLPFPPPPHLVPNPATEESHSGPLLLPNVRSASPEHSPFVNGSGNDVVYGRPLPSPPPHPSLRPPPVFSEDGENSGEMSMEQLLAVLNADNAQDPLSQPTHDPLYTVTGTENVTTRRAGAVAWEEASGVETVKRALPAVPVHPTLPQSITSNEEEMSVEELLKLEEPSVGAAAWEGGAGRETVKRVSSVTEDTLISSGSLRVKKDGSGRVSMRKLRNSVKRVDELGSEEKRALGDVFSLREEPGEGKIRQEDEPEEIPRKQQEGEALLTGEIEINEMRSLVDAFRVRLETVEARVEEMELTERRPSEAHANQQQQQLSAGALLHQLRLLAYAWVWSAGAGIVSLLPAWFRSSISLYLPWPLRLLFPQAPAGNAHSSPCGPPANKTGSSSGSCSDSSSPPPSTISPTSTSRPPNPGTDSGASFVWRMLYPTTIPRYALLLGIGVCAVVLRGLMRVGRGLRVGVGAGLVGASSGAVKGVGAGTVRR